MTELLAKGWSVTAVTRNSGRELPTGVKPIVAENLSRQHIIANLDHTIDVVFDPTAYDEVGANDLLSAEARFGSAVVVSSCSVYADKQGRSLDETAQNGFPHFHTPMTEATPTVPPGAQTYSTRKVAMENVFRATPHHITILRPCAIYGIHATHPREWWLIKRGLDGRKHIPISYLGESLFHTSSAAGIASLAELCMDNPASRILNVADPKPLSVCEIASALESSTQLPINLYPFVGPPQGSIGASPWSIPLPYTLDCSAAKAMGWDGGQPYAQAVKEMANWLLQFKNRNDWKSQFNGFANYTHDPFDYAVEDKFIKAN